jgi:hypothetical protein
VVSELARLGVEDAYRPDGDAVGGLQKGARIELKASLAVYQLVAIKTGIEPGIGDDQHVLLKDRMSTERCL